MSAELKKLEQAAGQLQTKERARLIRRLISTLRRDGEGDVEQIRLGEAERPLSSCRRYEDCASAAFSAVIIAIPAPTTVS